MGLESQGLLLSTLCSKQVHSLQYLFVMYVPSKVYISLCYHSESDIIFGCNALHPVVKASAGPLRGSVIGDQFQHGYGGNRLVYGPGDAVVGSPVGFHNSANHVQVQQSGLQMVRMDPGLPGIAFDSRTPSQARVALNISYHFANIYSVLQAAGWITECLGPNHAYVRGPPDNREGHQDSRTRAYTNLQYPVYNYICMSARCHQNDSDMVFGCCIVSSRPRPGRNR